MTRFLLFFFLLCHAVQFACAGPDWNGGLITPARHLCLPGFPGIIKNLKRSESIPGFSLSYQWRYSLSPPVSGTDFLTWALIPGATGSDLIPASVSQTTYYVRIATYNYCKTNNIRFSNVCEVKVLPAAGRVIAINGADVCSGYSLQLIADHPGSFLTWNTGDTSQYINVKASGLYSFIFKGQFGCFGNSDSLSIKVGKLSADFNNDRIVNILDFNVLNSNFGQTCSGCSQDINKDGYVDNYDFLLFAGDFSKGCSAIPRE